MSNKLNTAFVGCSFTFGDGFDPDDRDPYIYPTVIADRFMFDPTNLSVSGASNHMIFLKSADAIKSKKYDIVVCQWTALNRLWLSPGPNTWYYTTGDSKEEFIYRDIQLSSKDKIELENKILLLNHDYQNIIDLIDYVNILDDLAQLHNIKIIHINGLVPWQNDLTNTNALNDFDLMSAYTKEILDFDNRDDKEISALLQQLQLKFSTLDTNNWVNLFDAFQNNMVDLGPQGHHPGIQSHLLMADKLDNYLTQGPL